MPSRQTAFGKRLRFGIVFLVCLLGMGLFASASSAAGTIDQSNLTSYALNAGIENGLRTAQTFTAGMTGNLTTVVLDVDLTSGSSPSGPLVVQVTGVSAGAPDTTNVLATETIPASWLTTSPQITGVTLTTPVPVVTGQHYAIVLSYSPLDALYGWASDGANGYAAGSAFYSTGGSWIARTWDLSFETLVSPATPSNGAGPRGAYCTASGNTTDSGIPWTPGTFVNLDDGQVNSDPSYRGATMAIFVAGKGLTCDPPPSGYTRHGLTSEDLGVDGNTYPYYAP